MHPSDEIRGIKSSFLKDKRIILAVTGSIAAVETIRLSRELIRHGATVIPVMTPAATKIIHPDALWFATGKKPIIELTGDTEHVRFCGRVHDPVDLLLIVPSTANTISKIANGIDDTAVTTFATTAIGSNRPIILVPAMHLSMYDHSIIQENIEQLKHQGIEIVDPFFKDNKAKLANNERIIARVIHRIGPNKLKGKKILIIGGSTREPVDDVRCLTNISSGKTAISLVKNAYFNGASVILWYGQSESSVPSYISLKRFSTIQDVKKLVNDQDLDAFDIIIVCAALADYIPDKKDGKFSSTEKILTIHCSQAEKILPLIRKSFKGKLIGYKLAENKEQSIDNAKQFISKNMVDAVVANLVSSIGSNNQKVWVVDRKVNQEEISGSKDEVANQVLSYIASVIS